MKQIKTIFSGVTETFDDKVNAALADGWTLVNRHIFPEAGFVAELEREVITEEERCCENCQHYDKDPESEPCASCPENAELPVRNLIVWDKKSGPGSYYTFAHELIIFGTAASKLLHKGGTNVWRMAAFSSGAKSTNGEKVHPTQKPVEIIAKMIEDATEPGAVVLDTFMGSGTTAVACLRTGRNFIGFELDEKYHAIAMERIAAETPAAASDEPEDDEDWMA